MKIPFTDIEVILSRNGMKKKTPEEIEEMPTKGGRVSSPESVTLFGALVSEFSQIDPDYPIEFVKVLTNLAMYNSDLSYAVNNVIQLGNSPYKIYYADNTPDSQQKEMSEFLATRNKELYTGGINSYINDLLAQAAVTGVMSTEIVPNQSLTDVEELVLVNPVSIKYVLDNKKYVPYQNINHSANGPLLSMIRLNPVTYKYYPLQRFSEKPYGIPPFLSALEAIEIERPMIKNLKNVVQRIGAFGFLSVLVNAPVRKQGEGDDAYKSRCRAYLNDVYKETDSGFNKGLVIGFDNTHKFKIEGSANNVQGSADLFKLVTEMKFAGLKQDPLMLGRNFNVAETMSRVILAKLTTQIANYQKLTASVLEDVFRMRLLLAGYKLDNITVEFDPAMIGDRSKDAEAYGKEIDNSGKLYNAGIIDHVTRAKMLGFDEPAEDEPLMTGPIDPNKAKDDPNDPTETGDSTDPKTTDESNMKFDLVRLEYSLGKYGKEFPYWERTSMAPLDEGLMEEAYRKYFKQTKATFVTAVDKSVKYIAKQLAGLSGSMTAEQVAENIRYHLYVSWAKNFTPAQTKVIEKNITEGYKNMRQSRAFFEGIEKGIPDATFSLNDIRAVEYFKNSDRYYLGKFITDENVNRNITEYIKKNYLEDNMPIGGNKEGIAKFQAEFGDVLKMQDWKVEQIITTTVNSMRNTAGLYYLEQAGITKYEILGVVDRLQSDFCRAINGKQFEVSTTVNMLQTKFGTDPKDIKTVAPFGASLVPANEVSSMTAAALQQLGVGIPPYHGNCRTRIVAVV